MQINAKWFLCDTLQSHLRVNYALLKSAQPIYKFVIYHLVLVNITLAMSFFFSLLLLSFFFVFSNPVKEKG